MPQWWVFLIGKNCTITKLKYFPLLTWSDQCLEGETYMQCGTACQNKCGQPEPRLCTMQCMPPGCYCSKKGYARNSIGVCVPVDHCDPHPLCKN